MRLWYLLNHGSERQRFARGGMTEMEAVGGAADGAAAAERHNERGVAVARRDLPACDATRIATIAAHAERGEIQSSTRTHAEYEPL